MLWKSISVLCVVLTVSTGFAAEGPVLDQTEEGSVHLTHHSVTPKMWESRHRFLDAYKATGDPASKMLPDDAGRLRNLSEPATIVVWTIGEETDHHATPMPTADGGAKVLVTHGRTLTEGETRAIESIAPIVWRSSIFPSAMVQVPGLDEVEALAEIGSVYMLEVETESILFDVEPARTGYDSRPAP